MPYFKQKLLSVLILANLLSGIAFSNAATPWQQQTVQDLKSTWLTPPPEYGPEPYFQLSASPDVQIADLDQAKALGFTAVTVQYNRPKPGQPDITYLSPKYFESFKRFVAAAKARDMRIWIVDEAGYPSGFAGGKFSSDAPALRMQALSIAERLPVAGGETFVHQLPPDTVAVTALGADGQAIQIPMSTGTAQWTAPAGQWTVNVITHVFRTSPTRSATNPTGAKDESQSLEDYMDPAATQKYIEFTHDAYKAAVGDEFGKTILGFRGDEPDFSIRGIPWTPAFFDTFQKDMGYDVRPYLAQLMQDSGRPAATRDQGKVWADSNLKKVWADYNEVFSRMFAAGYFQQLGQWCDRNHLGYQIHINHEEQQIALVKSEGDYLRDMKPLQVPGIDAIWHQIWFDTISDYPRLASSAAHLYGRQHAFTESFAAYIPRPDVKAAQYIIDEQLVRGVNTIEMMNMGGGRISQLMQQPGFLQLATYTRRLSYLMSSGRAAAHVALLMPRAPFYDGDTAADIQYVSTERLLSEQQIDFDLVNEDAIATDLVAVPGGLKTLSGNTYRTIIIPMSDLLNAKTVTRLKAFAAGGGKVLFTGRYPTAIVDRDYRDARAATPSDFSWATLSTEQLAATPTPPHDPPSAPPAPLNPPSALVDAVRKATGAEDLTVAPPNPGLRYTHRQLGNGTIYLLFNEQAAPLSTTIVLNSASRKIETWNAGDGTTAAATVQPHGKDQVAVPIQLAPYTTQLLVVQKDH